MSCLFPFHSMYMLLGYRYHLIEHDLADFRRDDI